MRYFRSNEISHFVIIYTCNQDPVIGAGSVVVRDVPPHSIASWSSCKSS